ncbi:MAG: hypothetical protein IPN55_17155 [Saprospiraceae bacterium]|nr:hypothetical protein [Candidatus Brachybacter algidus]
MKSDIKKLNILVDRSIHLKTKESRILKKYYQAEEDVKMVILQQLLFFSSCDCKSAGIGLNQMK